MKNKRPDNYHRSLPPLVTFPPISISQKSLVQLASSLVVVAFSFLCRTFSLSILNQNNFKKETMRDCSLSYFFFCASTACSSSSLEDQSVLYFFLLLFLSPLLLLPHCKRAASLFFFILKSLWLIPLVSWGDFLSTMNTAIKCFGYFISPHLRSTYRIRNMEWFAIAPIIIEISVDLSRGRLSRRFSPCCPAKKFMPLNTIRSLFFRVFSQSDIVHPHFSELTEKWIRWKPIKSIST